MKKYSDVLRSGIKTLTDNGIEEASVDAYLLFEDIFDMPKSQYYLKMNQIADDGLARKYYDSIAKRAKHIPVQYITGKQSFYGLEFEVNPSVLIPRQDTEILVEECLKRFGHVPDTKVLDLCTGSGCIAISLKKNMEHCRMTAADISEPALEVAKKNAKRLEAEVTFLESNLFENVEGSFDLIVSNPPYIPTKVIETLAPEVREHEPHLALDGTGDGLLFYRKIVTIGKSHLKENGCFAFEIGFDQAEDVSNILEENGFNRIQVVKDLPGLDRVVIGSRN